MSRRGAPFHPFFLHAEEGERYCIFHLPAGPPRGRILYAHPFAEEMNKSRRMAALQSRMLAALGYGVLQVDLYGCGDSEGELRDATWDLWKGDLALADRWLAERVEGPMYLWGLRLGALLALDYGKNRIEPPGGYLLWQPVAVGEAFLSQFLRLQVAARSMGGGPKTSTHQLRETLESGVTLEIAGYDVSSALAHAIDSLALERLAPRGTPVYWLEIVTEAGRTLSPASRRVVDAWTARDVEMEVETVAGEPFWNTVEIADNPALLAATMTRMGQVCTPT